jgi:small-conductance mechanosensitive channel
MDAQSATRYSDSSDEDSRSGSPLPSIEGPTAVGSVVNRLPEHVAKLSAANEMLRASLQTAHKDITSLLVQRDDLTADLRSTEGLLEETLTTSKQWLDADLELTKRRQEMLREGIQSTRDIRQRMAVALARLSGGSPSGANASITA